MKNKLISAIVCLALALTLLPPVAGAVEFSDIDTHWAKPEIARAVTEGLVKGYEDGTFRPDRVMLTSEALALCARIAVPDEATRAKIGAARAEEMDALLGGRLEWFYDDFATCLELGILRHDDLAWLLRSGRDEVPMQKGEFARYLVFAMGLGSLALSLEDIDLKYTDAAIVPEEYRSAIYLLDLHGVVNGTPEGEIQPLSPLSRAVAATMLVRLIDAIRTSNISVELPCFTTYNWTAGYITDVTAGVDGTTILTVNGMLGRRTVTLLADGKVFQNNMPAQRTRLEVGAYARIALSDSGNAAAVRVVAAERLIDVSGLIDTLDPEEITVGQDKLYLNRFTAVNAAGRTGDRSIIDYDAGYTAADCIVDNLGNVLHLTLRGGSREEPGILSAVEISQATGAATISLSGYDGRITRYAIPAGIAVTSGGIPAEFKSVYIGSHVTLRVNSDDLSEVVAAELDLSSKYIQGVFNNLLTTTENAASLTVDGRTGSYQFAEECVVTFSGEPTVLTALKNGSYFTARLQGGQIIELFAWPGAVETRGILTNIAYGPPTVLAVTTEDGRVEEFTLGIDDVKNVTITRGGATAGMHQLATGDSVVVLLRYHVVSSIEATPRSANITGVVEEIAFNAAGASITLSLPSGETVVYAANSSVTVVQEGSISTLSNIKVGATLALVTEGERVVSIEIRQSATSNTKLEGIVYTREASGRKLTLSVSDGAGGTKLVVVNILGSVSSIQDTSEGSLAVNRIQVGDRLEVWGAYNKQEFDATIVVRIR